MYYNLSSTNFFYELSNIKTERFDKNKIGNTEFLSIDKFRHVLLKIDVRTKKNLQNFRVHFMKRKQTSHLHVTCSH